LEGTVGNNNFFLGKMSSVLSCNQIKGCIHTTTVHTDILMLLEWRHSSATSFTDSYDKHRWL